VTVSQVSLFFHLSGGGVVGLFRFSYKYPPNQKTPGATSFSFEKKNLRILFSIKFIHFLNTGAIEISSCLFYKATNFKNVWSFPERTFPRNPILSFITPVDTLIVKISKRMFIRVNALKISRQIIPTFFWFCFWILRPIFCWYVLIVHNVSSTHLNPKSLSIKNLLTKFGLSGI